MKKLLIFAITIIGFIGCLTLYTACKKTSSSSSIDNPIVMPQNSSMNKRSAGTEIYYSRDLETNTSYKLTITTNADNEITIHREINTDAPELDSMRTYYGFDEDVNYTITSEKVVRIDAPAIGNTYLIPFKPNHEIVSYLYGEEISTTEFYCTCSLAISSSPSCQADLMKLKSGTLVANCVAKNCQTCKLHAVKATKKKSKSTALIVTNLNTNDGFIVIDGNKINEI